MLFELAEEETNFIKKLLYNFGSQKYWLENG